MVDICKWLTFFSKTILLATNIGQPCTGTDHLLLSRAVYFKRYKNREYKQKRTFKSNCKL